MPSIPSPNAPVSSHARPSWPARPHSAWNWRDAGSNFSDTSSNTGQQILSVGKRLSSNALLSYEQTLGKAEGIVKLTVNLTRQIAIIGRAGSDNALDIFYTLSFGRNRDKTLEQ